MRKVHGGDETEKVRTGTGKSKTFEMVSVITTETGKGTEAKGGPGNQTMGKINRNEGTDGRHDAVDVKARGDRQKTQVW